MEVVQETIESAATKLELKYREKVFFTEQNQVLVRLAEGEKIYIKGQVNVEAVCGVLEVLGSYIRPKDGVNTVFSPRGYSLLYIGAYEGAGLSDFRSSLSECLDRLKFQDNDEVRRVLESDSSSVIALLSRVLDDTDCINLYLKHSSGGGLRLFARDGTKFRSLPQTITDIENVLNINMAFSQQAIGGRFFQPGTQWETAIMSANITTQEGSKPRLLIAGGKGVGKSTFARYLVNRLLSELGTPVLFIDVDPGQAEFSLPGTLSCTIVKSPVLGPNFTHVHWKKEVCYYIGSVDVSSCRNRYTASMTALKKFCQSYTDLPWIINTMGFSKGLGLTLMSETLKAFKPSTVIEIYSRSRHKNFESVDFFARNLSSLKIRCNVLRFEAIPESINDAEIRSNDNWGLPQPSLLRDIVILSHLKTAFSSQPLQNIVPRAVTWSEVYLQIIDLENSFSTSNLIRVLNLSFVCLGRVEEFDLPQRKPDKLNLLNSPDLVTPALGFGIIRSIDVKRNIFYIITDLPDEIIKDVNILTYGSKVRLPDGIIARQPDKNSSTPYVAHNETKSLLATPWERNFKPKYSNNETKVGQ